MIFREVLSSWKIEKNEMMGDPELVSVIIGDTLSSFRNLTRGSLFGGILHGGDGYGGFPDDSH